MSGLTSLDVSQDENEQRAAAILHQVQHDLGATVFFEKPLTASDASGSGRVVIPKAIAEQYFPRLEQPCGLPVRAVDTRGHEYTFKFRFWINNQSRMYLLEGAGELHRQFTMVVGDVMVFAQKTDRTLVVAGRPATKNDVIRKAPVKRPAGETKEKVKGGREPRVKQARHAGGGAAAAPHRKKAKPSEVPSLELDPSVDGIFRAVSDSAPCTESSSVAPGLKGRWVVTLNLAGELYQALFDSAEDAEEAFNAAGGPDGKGPMVGLSLQGRQYPQSPQPVELKEGLGGVGAVGLGLGMEPVGLGLEQQQGGQGVGQGGLGLAGGPQGMEGAGAGPQVQQAAASMLQQAAPQPSAGMGGLSAGAGGAALEAPQLLVQAAPPQLIVAAPQPEAAAPQPAAAAPPQPVTTAPLPGAAEPQQQDMAAPQPVALPQPAAAAPQQATPALELQAGLPSGGGDAPMGGVEAGEPGASTGAISGAPGGAPAEGGGAVGLVPAGAAGSVPS